ncbi:hypothetical protein, partial [Mycobacteroides abscessus]|uniref:hypothetical protein n=1 Tax=Mycobacteroides abscessus TaxID=36809 RepID=UPI001A9A227E
DILPAHPSRASQLRCHLFVQQTRKHQRLYRWKPTDWRGAGRAFVIDVAWLNSTIDKLSAASSALSEVRPLHKNSAFNKTPLDGA